MATCGADGVCAVDNGKADAPCDDGDACSTADVCKGGSCVAGTAKACADDNPCTDDGCDAKTGCTHSDNNAGCDDGDICTPVDTCGGGACLPGAATVCDDGNPCTDDTCDTKAGCIYAANEADCDDGDACTGGDACAGSACKGLQPTACNDGNPCTDDSCDPKSGCVSVNNKVACSDGSVCTVDDACADGECQPGPPEACADKDPCTDDACDPAKGCTNAANTAACDDGDACTTGDGCADGACKGQGKQPCDDANPCTDDGCDAKTGCIFTANGASCSDGNVCTVDDACKASKCVPGAAKVCDDKILCTNDGCDAAKGCTYSPNALPCGDGDPCTGGDACKGGKCTAGAKVDCDDGKFCTIDSCAAGKGCVHAASTAKCQDGNACTTKEVCKGGQCVAGLFHDCDDGKLCTANHCNPKAGCYHIPNQLACDDGSLCTQGDVCKGGKCTPGKAIGCNDGNPCTKDGCGAKTGCVFLPNSVTCTDGNTCTLIDTCNKASCVPGKAKNCDDSNACTTDLCHPLQGCSHINHGLPCTDGDACTNADVCKAGKCAGGAPVNCNDGKACTDDKCDAKAGCTHSNNSASCDDGNVCTIGDGCKLGVCAAGAPLNCKDGLLCTTDTCDPKKGCQFNANTLPCDDGNACTVKDACKAGSCAAGTPKDCNDGNSCTLDTCAADKGCAHPLPEPATPCDGGACFGGKCVTGGTQGNPATSCLALKKAEGTTPDAVYWLDPDGPGKGQASYRAWCDMKTNGGGWTLLMKIDGKKTNFGYDNARWLNKTAFQADKPAFDKNEAKLGSFWSVPFSTLRLGMIDGGVTRWLDVPYKAASLWAALQGGYKATKLGRDKWKGLLAAASLQLNCNKEGFNVYHGYARVRIGIHSNQENDCSTPDSRIGFGGGGAACGQDHNNTCGNTAKCSGDAGDRNTKVFGYVLAR